MMKIKDITSYLEQIAPPALQESYDNAGLITGNHNDELTGILITLDVTEDVINEAVSLGANMVVAHHPIVFGGLKKLNGNNYVERTVILAIRNNIAIYAAHTNLDSVIYNGVNSKIAEKLNLKNISILAPVKNMLNKLVVFVPERDAEKVRQAIFESGAGHIGNYDCCSYNLSGTGTFRANEQANPFVGTKGELHFEPEVRIETILPQFIASRVISAMTAAHPYEEAAYDLYPLNNTWTQAGAGMVGELQEPMDENNCLQWIKQTFHCEQIRHTPLLNRKVKKIALCGGSGSFLIKDAIRCGADIFVTGDVKYHQFFDAENKVVIADIGHYESEQFTKDLFYELLTRKFSNFAVHFTKVNTNPIKYL